MNRTGFNICVGGICGENKSTLGARLGHHGAATNWRKKTYRATFQGQIKRLKSFF